jgi:hypothetical protein
MLNPDAGVFVVILDGIQTKIDGWSATLVHLVTDGIGCQFSRFFLTDHLHSLQPRHPGRLEIECLSFQNMRMPFGLAETNQAMRSMGSWNDVQKPMLWCMVSVVLYRYYASPDDNFRRFRTKVSRS